MKTELILKSDVLDILFENRNKAYGAYNLRKFYNNRLIKSLGVMLGIAIILSAFTFIPEKKIKEGRPVIETVTSNILHEKKAAVNEKKEVAATIKKPVNSIKITSTILITKDTVIKPLNTITPNTAIGNVNVDVPGNDEAGELKPSFGGSDGKSPDAGLVKSEVIDAVTPQATAEIMPSFPGGIEALKKFLQKNLTNPKEMEQDETVSVKIKFVVGYDGKLKSFATVQDGGEQFNKEVIRVLKKMPDWVPGKTKGQNVSVYFTIPVKFVPAD